jgi:hypothetical protein
MKLRCSNPSLVIYLVWVYALPAFLNICFEYEPDVYLNPANSLYTWIYGGLLFVVAISFAFRLDAITSSRANIPSPILSEIHWRTLIVLLITFMVVGVFGAMSGLSQWRYSAIGLSSSLDIISLLFVLAPNVLELILFILLFFKHELKRGAVRNIAIIVFICLGLTASGIGPMIAVLMALLTVITPVMFRRLIFKEFSTNQSLTGKLTVIQLILLFPIIIGLGGGAYLVGDAIKTGTGLIEVFINNINMEINSFIHYFIGRISVHWYSINTALHQMVELGVGDPVSNLMAPLANAGFRFSSLTGDWLSIERPLNGSMARINYNLVSLYPFNDREGTSPGLIATFVLAFPIWIGPLALAGYLWVYDKVQLGLRRRFDGRLTLFGESIFLYFTSILFASPVDFLLLFDPMLFSVLALCYLGLSNNKSIKNHASFQSSY